MSNNNAVQQLRAIVLLAAAAFMSGFAARVCDPLLPRLAQAFHVTTGEASWTVSSFAVTYGVFQVFSGAAGDRFGKYRVIAWSTLATAATFLGAALAPSLPLLVLARMLAGAATVALIPLAMAWIGDTVPYERRQGVLGRFISGQILGIASGQMVGGYFADYGWRWAFGLAAVACALIGLLLFRELRVNPAASRRPDAGAASSSLSIAAQVREVFRRPWAYVVILSVFVEGMMMFGGLAFVPAYLHHRFGIPLAKAGSVLAAYGIGGLAYTLIAKQLVSRLGERGVVLLGGVLLCVVFITLRLVPSWTWEYVVAAFAGLGFYFIHNTLQTNSTQMAPSVRGTAVSIYSAGFFLGQSAGVAGAAVIVDHASIDSLFFISAAGLAATGAAFSWLIGRRARIVAMGPAN